MSSCKFAVFNYVILITVGIMFPNRQMEAQEITYSEHIAPIIYANCTTCHRQGEIGPMPFTNYDEVKAWSGMVRSVTQSQYMPPWSPSTEYSRFQGERVLTDQEIAMIAEWVGSGTPQGDPALEPELPIFPTGSQVGTPDLVLTMEEAYMHVGDGSDDYRVFVLPTNLTEDREIAAVELRPGNPAIVHHALFSYDTSGEARELDDQDPAYGYDGFGGFGIDDAFTRQYPGYVPGQAPFVYPQGLGKLLPAGADILMQMHYGPVYSDELDQSTINIFFKDEPVERQVREFIMLPFAFSGTVLDKPFFIPPNEVTSFHGTFEVPIDVSILSIAPHMHLLGARWEVYIENPDGTVTNLIEIPEWDFNWQGTYNYPQFKIARQGSILHAIATYDNTADNPVNPNVPPRLMSWGEETTDEMYYLPISYVPYRDGDEDLVFDETTTSIEDLLINQTETQLLDPFPNPAQDQISVTFNLGKAQRAIVELRDASGKLLAEVGDRKIHAMGHHTYQMDIEGTPAGRYIITLTTDRGFTASRTIVIE